MMFNRTIRVISIWFFAFLGMNLVFVPLMNETNGPSDLLAHVGFCYLGMIGSQFCIVAACTALMTTAFRLTVGGILAAGLYSAFFLGVVHASRPYHDDLLADYFGFLLCGPLTLLGCQLPLLVARAYRGWRLLKTNWPESPAEQFGIRDVLIGTTLIAVAIASTQASTTLLNNQFDGALPIWIFAGICCLCSALTSLPSCAATLKKEFKFRNLVVPLLLQTLVVSLFIVFIWYSEGRRPPTDILWLVGSLLFGFFAATSGFFVSLRWAGWRLETRYQPINHRHGTTS